MKQPDSNSRCVLSILAGGKEIAPGVTEISFADLAQSKDPEILRQRVELLRKELSGQGSPANWSALRDAVYRKACRMFENSSQPVKTSQSNTP